MKSGVWERPKPSSHQDSASQGLQGPHLQMGLLGTRPVPEPPSLLPRPLLRKAPSWGNSSAYPMAARSHTSLWGRCGLK